MTRAASLEFTHSSTGRWLTQAGAVVAGSLLLWASAKVQLPFYPVPLTLQTYVVLVLGALLGWRLGGAAVAAYLAKGAIGLPVFAGTPEHGVGLAYMAGPTGGYLAGYALAALLVGLLADRGWTRSMLGIAAMLLAGELAILALGWGWLALQLGGAKALALGIAPFLYADALKLVLAFGTIAGAEQARNYLAARLARPRARG